MGAVRIQTVIPESSANLWGFPSDPDQVEGAEVKAEIQTAINFHSPQLLNFRPLSSFDWASAVFDKPIPVFIYEPHKKI